MKALHPVQVLINLRVLNSNGTGTTASVLNALNWMLTPYDPTRAVSFYNPLNKDRLQHPRREYEFGSRRNRFPIETMRCVVLREG